MTTPSTPPTPEPLPPPKIVRSLGPLLPFRLDYRAVRGAVVNDHEQLHEWNHWLRIRSDISGFIAPAEVPRDDDMTGYVPPAFEQDGLAVEVRTRSVDDLDEPVGLFHTRLDFRELTEIRDAIESIDWAALPKPVGGDIRAFHVEFEYVREGLTIQRGWNARSWDFIKAIKPVDDILEQLARKLRARPAAALALSVAHEPDPKDPRHHVLRMTLTNVGTGSAIITDPRVSWPERTPAPRPWDRSWRALPRASWELLRLLPDGYRESEGELVQAPLAPEGTPTTMILRPKQRFEMSMDWHAPEPGNYVLHGRWMDYEGPLKMALDQQPIMPLPLTGPASDGRGVYPIHGAAFAYGSAPFEVAK